MACPFCGNDTSSRQLFCDQCGASLKVDSFDLGNDEVAELFPSSIVYEGCARLSSTLVFRNPLEESLWEAKISVESSPLHVTVHFVPTSKGIQAGGSESWKLSFHQFNDSKPAFHAYGSQSEMIGQIVAEIPTPGVRNLRIQERSGKEIQMWSQVRVFQRAKNGFIKAGLYFRRMSSLWQGWEDTFEFRGLGFDTNNQIPCGVTGDVTVPEFYIYRFQELCDTIDYRLVLGALSLQSFGIWDPIQIPEYLATHGLRSIEPTYDLH